MKRIYSFNKSLIPIQKKPLKLQQQQQQHIDLKQNLFSTKINSTSFFSTTKTISKSPNLLSFIKNKNTFNVLGIETSCDDTGVAIVNNQREIISETVISQEEHHEPYRGIKPLIAARAHQDVLDTAFQKVLDQSGMTMNDIDVVATTCGPGLALCLKIGVTLGKNLATTHRKPFIAVNHLEAHLLTPRLTHSNIEFPFLVLLVSGGHCLLAVAHDVNQYTLLGSTMDDSLGEAFDKVARLLGINMGGGKQLEALAKQGDPYRFRFAVPLRKNSKPERRFDFSYSGLKTQILRKVRELEDPHIFKSNNNNSNNSNNNNNNNISINDSNNNNNMKYHPGFQDSAAQLPSNILADVAAGFQHTALQHIEDRVKNALNWCQTNAPGMKKLVVSGGVAANDELRTRISNLSEKFSVDVLYPPHRLCTDNGVMVAWAGVERALQDMEDDVDQVDLRARWPLPSP